MLGASRRARRRLQPRHRSRPADPPAAYPLALQLLSRRELTTAELRERLAGREVPTREIESVIEALTADGTLNDRRAAAAIARMQAAVKGRGRQRVERELMTRGIAREVAGAALDEVFGELSEPALLEQALQRRLRGGPIGDAAHFRRLYQYLLRQGFSSDAVVAILKKHS